MAENLATIQIQARTTPPLKASLKSEQSLAKWILWNDAVRLIAQVELTTTLPHDTIYCEIDHESS